MLVDTSVWIDYFNDNRSPEAERLINAIKDDETIALPGIIWTEILIGLGTETEAARIYRTCRDKGLCHPLDH
jgi:predicted nucleic acid-binding protein